MALPPKPPPTMRAPCAPASSAASTIASSSGTEISKSSRSDAWPGGQHRPDRPRVGVPAQRGDHLEHPGVLGDDVPRPAQQDLALGVPSARASSAATSSMSRSSRDAEPRRGLLALAPPVAVAALGVVVCDVPESTTSSASPAAARSRGTCSLVRSRVSRNSACPAVQSTDADWSRMPVGAPTKSFSARRASSTRSGPRQLGRDEVAQGERDRAGRARPTRTARRPPGRRCRPGCSRRRPAGRAGPATTPAG